MSALSEDLQGGNGNDGNMVVSFSMEKLKLNARPTIGMASVAAGIGLNIGLDREKQIDERDVFSEIGRQVEEKGWIPEGRMLGPGRIYTGTMYVHGKEIKIEESDKLIKVGNEFYVCEDTLPKISSNNFVKANGIKMLTLKGTYADIDNELGFEYGQKVNGKGVEFKIKIQEQSNSGRITEATYYHLESMIELGMREHFYTNRLQKEMYVVKNAATREGGYGLVVYEDDYIKNVKMENLYILKKDRTVEEITPFTVMKKGLVGLYDKIIPDNWGDIENLNKADEALGDIILVSASTAAGLGETGFALTPQGAVVVVSSLAVAAGAGLGQACVRVAKKDICGALLSLCGASFFTAMASTLA